MPVQPYLYEGGGEGENNEVNLVIQLFLSADNYYVGRTLLYQELLTCGLHEVLVGVSVPYGRGHHGHRSRVAPERSVMADT